MGLFDNDPRYQKLNAIRESGYDGPLDRDNQPVDPLSPEAQAVDDLRRRGAGAAS